MRFERGKVMWRINIPEGPVSATIDLVRRRHEFACHRANRTCSGPSGLHGHDFVTNRVFEVRQKEGLGIDEDFGYADL